MYSEKVDGLWCRVRVACDRPACMMAENILGADHDDAQKQLYRAGWRLYRGKQLCPKHAAAVAKRLNREAAKAWSV